MFQARGGGADDTCSATNEPAPAPPTVSTRCVAAVPTIPADAHPSVIANVQNLVAGRATAFAACGRDVGAASGRVFLTFGVDYDGETFPYYRVSKNETGNHALRACLMEIAKQIAEATLGFDLPADADDEDIGGNHYQAKVTLDCAPATP